MADLRELTTDAKRLYEAMDELLEKQDEAKSEDIDFKEIWFGAKSRAFQGHMVEKLDEYEADRYLKILSAMTALAEETKRKTIQIRFLARVLASRKNPKWTLSNLVSDGKMLQEKTLDEIQDLDEEEVRVSLIVDLLLMTYLDGAPEERQLDYVVGLMALFGWKKEKTKAIGMIVKGILEQDDDAIVAQFKVVPITDFYCYMRNVPDGVLVSDLQDAKAVQAKKIIFSGIEWDSIPLIKLDTYQAEEIEFKNCTFQAIAGLVNNSKKLILKDCVFCDSTVKENILCVKNADVRNCKFQNIKALNTEVWHLFVFADSHIEGAEFSNIEILHNSGRPYGGFLKSYSSDLKNIKVHKLSTSSSSRSEYRRVIDIYSGIVRNFEAHDCELAADSYLFTFSDGALKNDIKVEDLRSNYASDMENSSNNRAGVDISFEDMIYTVYGAEVLEATGSGKGFSFF